ncbi:hypothetical protein DSECCO2_183360 [anaerobic digester metagenome]
MSKIRRNIRTIQEVSAEFQSRGKSVAEWARENGLNPMVVYDLMQGRSAGKRGESHRAAVLLGIKDGVIDDRAGAA